MTARVEVELGELHKVVECGLDSAYRAGLLRGGAAGLLVGVALAVAAAICFPELTTANPRRCAESVRLIDRGTEAHCEAPTRAQVATVGSTVIAVCACAVGDAGGAP